MEKDPSYIPRSVRSRKRTDADVEDELLDARG